MPEQYTIVHMYHIPIIYSSVVGYLGCFQNLTIFFVNSAVINLGVQVALSYTGAQYFEYMLRSGTTIIW
jgi:hypothetical protein